MIFYFNLHNKIFNNNLCIKTRGENDDLERSHNTIPLSNDQRRDITTLWGQMKTFKILTELI